MPPRPAGPPIGLVLSRTARAVERAFDEALAASGGSRPTWLILMALKTSSPPTQVELARAVGIRGATLTHHLNAMEADGLVTRTRRPENRRVHQVELTESGLALFGSLVGVARRHDARLRAGLTEAQVDDLRAVLGRLHDNVHPEPT